MERLLRCLQDHDWQVREIAVLTLGELAYPETRHHVEAARSDITREVRTAADLALQAYDHQPQPRQPAPVDTKHPHLADAAMSHKERKSLAMDMTQMPSETIGQQATMPSLAPAAPLQPRQRRATRKVLLLATAAIVLVALTAAGFSYGWWNAAFGNPDLYQTVQQQQTDHGVTIVVTKVYVDEGRTVIAYDTYAANHAQDRKFFPDHTDLRGSVPAKSEGPLQATFGDPLRDGVTHSYMVIPAFLVPANVNTVTITWDIGRMLVSQPGQEKQPPAISGHWHFSFTVPFHHTDNPNIPDPIHGEMISPQ